MKIDVDELTDRICTWMENDPNVRYISDIDDIEIGIHKIISEYVNEEKI